MIFQGIINRLKAGVAARKRVREALAFNKAQTKKHDYSLWKCPNCGTVSKGADHGARLISGLLFPACCRKFCWHGVRSHLSDYIPDREYEMQPPEEFIGNKK